MCEDGVKEAEIDDFPEALVLIDVDGSPEAVCDRRELWEEVDDLTADCESDGWEVDDLLSTELPERRGDTLGDKVSRADFEDDTDNENETVRV